MVGDEGEAEIEEVFGWCLQRRISIVSVFGGIKVQSDDASRTAPLIFPSEILSEILLAKNFLGSFGFLDDLGIERWMASIMARSSPLRASKNLLRLQLTLE